MGTLDAIAPLLEGQVKAVVLLSGGLDSAVTLALAREEGRACHALSFNYGQRHGVELQAAAKVARTLGATHELLALPTLRGSALTGTGAVPTGRSAAEMADGIPPTYVPARNTVFLAHALSLAESMGAAEVWLGINALDYSGYPDCRPEWLDAMQAVARLGTKAGIEGHPVHLRAPLIHLTKREIALEARRLGVPIDATLSCYAPTGTTPCGTCDACLIRQAAV